MSGPRKTIKARVITAAGVIAAAALISGAAGYAVHGTSGPRCPTEDSCAVSYSGGEWHITPAIP